MFRSSLLRKFWILASFASAANAQDFFWTAGSARSQAMGGVYLPSARGAIDSLMTNPAGLTTLGAPTIEFSLSSLFASGSFSNSTNSDSRLRNSPGSIPYGAFGTPIGKSRFSVGMGILPEIASSSTWAYQDSLGVGGANYGAQTEHSAILAAQGVVGVGYTISKFLSVGVSMAAIGNTNTLESPYIFQSNSTLAGLKTLLSLHTSGFGVNTGIGVIARPTDKLQLNASWRSKSTIDSSGTASGDLSKQFDVLGVTAGQLFRYSAKVRNTLPQSVNAGGSLRVNPRWLVALTGNFTGWKQAFNRLPIALTNGNNGTVNSLLGSQSLYDTVPLQWKNQFSVHLGVERLLTEKLSIQAGFALANNPVPASTLSPLTAAISANKATTGAVYRQGRWQYNMAFSMSPETSLRVGQSALKGGEYSNSTVRIGIRSLTFDTSYQF